MFTDGPTTPVRLAVLLSTLSYFKKRGLIKRELIYRLIQPSNLTEDTTKIKSNIAAGIELGLIEVNGNNIILSKQYNLKQSEKENILTAFDKNVLAALNIEFHFALYYSYLLGLNKDIYDKFLCSKEDWVIHFNRDVYNNEIQNNAFNTTKLNGFLRWVHYVELGWNDLNNRFIPDPTDRIIRVLQKIMKPKEKIHSNEFMKRLSKICPELDGGEIFFKANAYKNYTTDNKVCTLGLSQALLTLHEDKIIELDCPIDSRGWIIESGDPPRDDSIKSNRITTITLK